MYFQYAVCTIKIPSGTTKVRLIGCMPGNMCSAIQGVYPAFKKYTPSRAWGFLFSIMLHMCNSHNLLQEFPGYRKTHPWIELAGNAVL